MADPKDDSVDVQSAADMGFGARDLGSVGTGAVYDASTDSGFGGGLGLTEDRGRELGQQVSQGSADAWGPSFGSWSHTGSAVGTALGLATGVPGLGILGGILPGAFNDIMGRGVGHMAAAGDPFEGSNSIAGTGAGGSGGLLGVGNDMSNADALAALYTLLMAKQKAA